MEKQVQRWFPKTSASLRGDLLVDSESLAGTSWCHIGRINRDDKSHFPMESATLEDLPRDFEDVSVELHRVLPSLSALAIHFTLKCDVSEQLVTLYDSHYLSRVAFHHWLPFRRRGFGLAEEPAEAARERAISVFVEEIRTKARDVVMHFFPEPSGFARRGLVALDQFHVSRGAQAPTATGTSTAWGRQFGLAPLDYASFKNDDASFLPPDDTYGPGYPSRLVVWSHPEAGGEKYARISHTIQELVPFMALLEVVRRSEDSAGRLRKQAFAQIARRRLAASFLQEVRLNSMLQLDRMLLDRLRMEYRQNSSTIAGWCDGLRSLLHVCQKDLSLLDAFHNAIARRAELASEHLQLASESSVSHIALRNIDVTYRLGWCVLGLTIVATLATVLGILGNWPAILCAVKWLVRWPH